MMPKEFPKKKLPMNPIKIKANLIDIHKRSIYPAEIVVVSGKISKITEIEGPCENYILPGLVDAHVHIESSMLTPVEFSRLATLHGTVATVSDPHEIANVLGLEGVKYMIENARHSPLKFHFGAPSCVPATTFETAGAVLGPEEVREMLNWPEIGYLSEMMNFPGVIYEDTDVLKKLEIAKEIGVPIDGHAPQLRGDAMRKYVNSGISTDHECTTYEEALEKIQAGMKIAIREGSAAKNFDALIPLIEKYPEQIMFCTDDKHPDELILAHIDDHIRRALKKGCDLFDVLRSATAIPQQHYKLNTGMLREGDPADFILIDHPDRFNVLETWIDGAKVASNGKSTIASVPFKIINKFSTGQRRPSDFEVKAKGEKLRVIKAIDGALVTESFEAGAPIRNGLIESDVDSDILMMTVVNRYEEQPPAVAFINGFGLKKGALASTVAHDSHNIVAVGTSRELLTEAVNALVKNKGGISATDGNDLKVLPLPIAGLLADSTGEEVAAKYKAIDAFAKTQLGSGLSAPFMTLSFMALLVIPSLKLSDKGLFDGEEFKFRSLFVNGQ
jgi:adenine deaminase